MIRIPLNVQVTWRCLVVLPVLSLAVQEHRSSLIISVSLISFSVMCGF